jgi:monooxygenase
MSHFDVVIVGAGLSGIGAAYHLQKNCPGKSYAILESRDSLGGTWDLFRYPGIRSDSDMHTLGYSFKPWRAAKAIADGPSILNYVHETADENAIRQNIIFSRRLESANWSSEDARWTLSVASTDSNPGDADQREREPEPITCNFLFMCSGYYSYDEPYRPTFEGEEDFEGVMFHPQLWPEDLDYKGKRVVVIGSGATAMTIVPSIAADVEHITMLQRSPTYVVSRSDTDGIANFLRKFLPEMLAYNITRFKNVELQRRFYDRTRVKPEGVKSFLLRQVRKHLGAEYVAKHITPEYNPWDQRVCLIPNADLFEAIKSGKASVATDQIESVTKKGIQLKSGESLDADIIIVATGLNMKFLGSVEYSVDDEPVQLPEITSYKGLMYSDLPNVVQTFGYINASWTLGADLTAVWACRVLNEMDSLGMRQCTPRLRAEDENMTKRPWIDDFSAGYMQRVMHLFPKQGDRAPWVNTRTSPRTRS